MCSLFAVKDCAFLSFSAQGYGSFRNTVCFTVLLECTHYWFSRVQLKCRFYPCICLVWLSLLVLPLHREKEKDCLVVPFSSLPILGCFAEQLRQYQQYSAGLLSERDMYPEHRSSILSGIKPAMKRAQLKEKKAGNLPITFDFFCSDVLLLLVPHFYCFPLLHAVLVTLCTSSLLKGHLQIQHGSTHACWQKLTLYTGERKWGVVVFSANLWWNVIFAVCIW